MTQPIANLQVDPRLFSHNL